MKRTSFFQRQLFFSLLGTIVLVILGFIASFKYMEAQHENHLREERRQTNPLIQYGRALEGLSSRISPEEALRIIGAAGNRNPPLFLLDESRRVLVSTHPEVAMPKIEGIQLPEAADEVLALPSEKRSAPFGPGLMRLDVKPIRYLLLGPPRSGFGPPSGPAQMAPIVFVISAALLSALLSFAVLFYYLRNNAVVIEDVMSRIHGGDLKARLPVKKLDEMGRLMSKFNEMADEIEQLVSRVREHEKNRVDMLQELGHDLRTPLASLSTMLETLDQRVEELSDRQKKDIASISVNETRYLSRLVDDLLFLARVDDPRYLGQGSTFDFAALCRQEIEALSIAQAAPAKALTFANELAPGLAFFGDEHLMKRMLRNAIENALAHATGTVSVTAVLDQGGDTKSPQIVLSVTDDGPGFRPEDLELYGTKRRSRSFREEKGKKISLGLGSVIIKAIVLAHQGGVRASNRLGQNTAITGALLEIFLPLRT